MRYFIEFSYNGQPFSGYQIQPNAPSIQETLEKGLSIILKEDIKLTGCGRTDTGVHARQYFAHFDSNQVLNQDLIKKLNSYFDENIAFRNIHLMKKDAHARFDAEKRTYKYFISLDKNPFNNLFSYSLNYPLDIDLMNNACQILFNHQDFTSFAKLHTEVKTNYCKIYEAYWEKGNQHLIFTITADRFLRNMVRAIVGTLIDVGRKKISIQEFNQLILDKNRNKAGVSMPAKGLFLWKIEYPEDIFSS